MYAKRIHIVPVGGETERMVEPLVEMCADETYLLVEEGSDASGVVDRLSAEGIGVAVENVDQKSVYAVLGLVTTLADRQDPEDTVRVNVSTGSRLATVGAALACMDEDTDAEAYVPTVDDEGEIADGESPVSVVPDYPIESPSRDGLAALAIVAALDTDAYTPKKRDLIDEALGLRPALDEPLVFVERIANAAERRPSEVTEFGDLRTDEQKGAYRTFREWVLAELKTSGYVVVNDESVGRSDPITLTATGEAALQAFRHRILDVVRALKRRETPEWLTDGMASRE
jgi:hypothetical protein